MMRIKMASKKKEVTPVEKAEISKAEIKSAKRAYDRALFKMASKSEEKLDQYTRQILYDDVFREFYSGTKGQPALAVCLIPPYNPSRMYELWEQTPMLASCVAAYLRNIDGYGHEIVPTNGDPADPTPQEQKEIDLLNEIFNDPNGRDSFVLIRENLRRDYELTGNSYLEIIRDNSGMPSMMFWLDCERMRLTPLDGFYTQVQTTLQRGGHDVDISHYKKFRRYVQITITPYTGKRELRWFKEFGDPRRMNAYDGSYLLPSPQQQDELSWQDGWNGWDYDPSIVNRSGYFMEATEVIHHKFANAGGAYGIPRWISTLTNVLGTASAEFLNYDLFENQGIPPTIITIANGQLTDDSWDDIKEMFFSGKDIRKFNRVLLLETESTEETMTPTGAIRQTPSRIQVQPMREARREDLMFSGYLQRSDQVIREQGFRLSKLYIGDSESINLATAKQARSIVEDQVFEPERREFDYFINNTIVRELKCKNVKFKSLGPKSVSPEDAFELLSVFVANGAFTMNTLIDYANKMFGTELEMYHESWADLPIPLVLLQAKGGQQQQQQQPHVANANQELGLGSTLAIKSEDEVSKVYGALRRVEDIAKNYLAVNCRSTNNKKVIEFKHR
jgi:PBSX family phage portal protein